MVFVQIGHRLSFDRGVMYGESLERQDSEYREISIQINDGYDGMKMKVNSKCKDNHESYYSTSESSDESEITCIRGTPFPPGVAFLGETP